MEEDAFANPVGSIFRFSLASRLQSDWMLMLFFAHTHLTVTVTVGLLLIPKVFFLYSFPHVRTQGQMHSMQEISYWVSSCLGFVCFF